jgi:Matrixin
MANSLREAATKIGLGASFSVLRHFFGHNTQQDGLSVRAQVSRVLGFRRIDLNMIRVGSDQFTAPDSAEIDLAVRNTRDTYAQVSLAIGRVTHWHISTAEADGYDNIGSDDEAEDLTDDWTVDNSALDIFLVLTYSGSTIGRSAVDGPCDKDAKGMDGSVVAIETNVTGLVLAHEAGHYLGLSHVNDSANLMNPTAPNGGDLTSGQGSNMRDHCFVKG